MGKIRDLFKKIRDTKGTFHAKTGTIKDRNGMDLTEAGLLRRDGKNIQKNYTKKISLSQITMMVWSLLETDILECRVKWAVGSITTNKASGGDEIPVELFQILKDDAVKVLHSVCQKIWKTKQWSQDWKRSVSIPIPKKGSAKKCANSCTIALILHASKVILKTLQARPQ